MMIVLVVLAITGALVWLALHAENQGKRRGHDLVKPA